MSRNLTWKRRLGKLRALFMPARTSPRRVILIYHSVGGGPLSLPAEQFRKQLDWLGKHARVVSLDELLEGQSTAKGLQVALTFDDGYRTLFSVVAPLLAERNWSATVYLNTGHIDDKCRQRSQPQIGHYCDEEFLLWDEVIQLAAQGWIIGSHGMDHVDLTKLPETEVLRQLMFSRDSIQRGVSQPCDHFAYTWGNHSADVRRAVKEAGYRNAAAAHHAPLSSGDDSLALPRIDIRKEYELQDFIAAVTGCWDFLKLIQKLKRVAG